MSVNKQCPECHADILHDALFGLCQKCLVDLAASASSLPTKAIKKSRRVFGDYELDRQIGRGGMGVVYAAMQMSLHRPVALKMILESEAQSPLVRQRFLVEAEAAAKLDHPNIVPIYEIGEHEGQPFISMKLIVGESLKDRISRGEFGPGINTHGLSRSETKSRQTRAAQIMAIVARAVQHAHDHGVLHRDLKPGNILLDTQGQPHLTDFGLAKIMEESSGQKRTTLTAHGVAMGTPSYMSPEQANSREPSRASDIYSLGAVLYELLTGQPPFKGASSLETLRAVTEQPVKRPSSFLPKLDRDLETICLRCLEKESSARYGSALELAEDLERWTRQEPIRARPAGLGKRLTRWCRRNPLAAGLIISLCAGLGLTIVLLQVANEQKRTLDLIRAQHEHEFAKHIDDLWIDRREAGVLIPSYELKALANLKPRAPASGELRLVFSIKILQHPLGQARDFALFLALAEEKMAKTLKRPVAFDIYFFRLNAGPARPIVSGAADFERMGALPYIRAMESNPELQLLVKEKNNREAVIFARRELGIKNLQGAKGFRAAFAHTNSTISFLAKAQLAKAGVFGGELKLYSNLTYRDPLSVVAVKDNGAALPMDYRDVDGEGMAHKEVAQHVLANSFDVGVVQRNSFEKYRLKGRGLTELHAFKVPGNVYVARSGLSKEVAEAFRDALLSMKTKKEKEILAARELPQEGFLPASDSDYNTMRSDATNQVSKFENTEPTPFLGPRILQ